MGRSRARKLFSKFMVKPERITRSRLLRRAVPGVADPSVWHLNRRSAARAMAVGLFWMIIPIPWQVIPAALCAVYFRANIAITVMMVCISNPLTWGPLLYGTYQLGRWLLDHPPLDVDGATLAEQMGLVWRPLFLGAIVTGILLGLIGYFATHWSWQAITWRAWRRRKVRTT